MKFTNLDIDDEDIFPPLVAYFPNFHFSFFFTIIKIYYFYWLAITCVEYKIALNFQRFIMEEASEQMNQK